MDPRQAYREQQLGVDDPLRLLLATYDAALRACRTGRRGLLLSALGELAASVDIEQGPIGLQLVQLYEYLIHGVREGRLQEVETHLRELRAAWESASSGPTPSV